MEVVWTQHEVAKNQQGNFRSRVADTRQSMPLSHSVLQADMINQSQQPFFLTQSSHLIQWSKQPSPTDHSWPTRGNLDMPSRVRQDTWLKITLLWVCVRPGKTRLIFNQPEFLWKQIRSYQVVECFTAEPHALPLLWSLTLRQSTNALLNDSDWENSGVQEKLAFGSGRQKSLKNKKEAPSTSDEKNPKWVSFCCYPPSWSFASSLCISHRGPTSHPLLQGEFQSWWHPPDFLNKVKIVLLPPLPGNAHPTTACLVGATRSSALATAFYPFSKLYSPIPRSAQLQNSKRSSWLCMVPEPRSLSL